MASVAHRVSCSTAPFTVFWCIGWLRRRCLCLALLAVGGLESWLTELILMLLVIACHDGTDLLAVMSMLLVRACRRRCRSACLFLSMLRVISCQCVETVARSLCGVLAGGACYCAVIFDAVLQSEERSSRRRCFWVGRLFIGSAAAMVKIR